MRTETRPIPSPDVNEILIKVMACGVCGSDVHIYAGSQGSTTTEPPMILGHEFAGIVVALGDNVTGCQVGDHVCVDPADNCNACWYCSNGMMSHCEHMRAIGTNVNGGFAQYCKVPARLVHKLNPDVPFEEGAMAEPLACCINGIDRSNIKAGDHVVVYGGGAIGLLLMQLAKRSGAAKVVLVEPAEAKRHIAEKLGADLTIDPNCEDVPEVLREKGISHIRCVIETCGLKKTAEQAVEIVDRGGTVLLFAVTSVESQIALHTYDLFQREITVTGSFCSPYTIARAVQMINSHSIDVSTMLAGKASLEELPQILSDAAMRAKGKYVILPHMEQE